MDKDTRTDAEKARAEVEYSGGDVRAGQVHATLALASSIETAARTLAGAMIEAARVRAGQRGSVR